MEKPTRLLSVDINNITKLLMKLRSSLPEETVEALGIKATR